MSLTNNPRRYLLLAILLMTVGQFPAGIYLPSMPSMAHHLHVTQGYIQVNFGLYLLTYGLSQLLYGPLSDRFGRRPIVMIGLSCFCVGSVVCVFATSITMLYIGSIIQGCALGSVGVISSATLRDLHKDKRLLHATAYLSAAAIITPLGSRVIGGYLQDFFDWQANFVFLFGYGVLALLIIGVYFAETHTQRPQGRFSLSTLLNNYRTVLRSPNFIAYSACRILAVAGGTSFAAASPYIYMNLIHLSPVSFAWYSIIVGIGFPTGSMMAKRLGNHFHTTTIAKIGTVFLCIGSIGFLVVNTVLPISVAGVVIPMIFYLIGNGTVFPTAMTGALLPLGAIAGTASALIGSLQNLSRGGLSMTTGLMHDGSILPIGLLLVGASIVCVLISFTQLRHENPPAV